MDNTELTTLIKAAASRRSLPWELVYAICQVESSLNPSAIRHEIATVGLSATTKPCPHRTPRPNDLVGSHAGDGRSGTRTGHTGPSDLLDPLLVYSTGVYTYADFGQNTTYGLMSSPPTTQAALVELQGRLAPTSTSPMSIRCSPHGTI